MSDASPLPMWVRSIAIVGIPGIIAIFLVWIGASNLARKSDVEALRAELAHYVQQADRNHRLLQQICANTANGNAERSSCFD